MKNLRLYQLQFLSNLITDVHQSALRGDPIDPENIESLRIAMDGVFDRLATDLREMITEDEKESGII